MIPLQTIEPIVFIGGRDYLPLFCELTEGLKSKRTAFYNSIKPPEFENCVFKRFNTKAQTNWHYDCAKALIEGKIRL